MPNKYPAKKGWKVPKQKYKISNWHNYNEFLLHRGNIEIWLSKEAIDAWYESNRIYDGTGAPKKFSDLAITVCHEIRLVFKLPLRQCQGFINSIFFAKNIELLCPYYSCLSKRLAQLNLSAPGYKKTDKPDEAVVALAIDSTGLKRFGRDEWHQEKHKVAAKRSWCKLHIAVDVNQVTADGAYDKTPVYEEVLKKFPNAEVVIPPDADAVYNTDNHAQRNRNLQEIKTFGRMAWKKVRSYGKRNFTELWVLSILGTQHVNANDLL